MGFVLFLNIKLFMYPRKKIPKAPSYKNSAALFYKDLYEEITNYILPCFLKQKKISNRDTDDIVRQQNLCLSFCQRFNKPLRFVLFP